MRTTPTRCRASVRCRASRDPQRHCRRGRLARRLALLLLLAPAGCTITRYYGGAPLRAEPSAIVEGESTKQDVLRLFGPPEEISHQTNGDAFIYLLQQENSSTFRIWDPITRNTWFTYTREHDARDAMIVLFDFTGVVRGVGVERRIKDLPLF